MPTKSNYENNFSLLLDQQIGPLPDFCTHGESGRNSGSARVAGFITRRGIRDP
jgi:hypothetical protein